MFDVVTCGFAPARVTAHPAHAAVRELPAPSAPDFLERGHDLLTRIDRRDGPDHREGPDDADGPGRPVLFVHAASPAARRRVATLRATVRTSTLAVGFGRPLTGLAAVATWLASLADRGVPVGVAVGHTLDHHAALLPTYVVTSSVAGVDLPLVRLSHHVLSWLPGMLFTLGLDEHPRITTGRLTASFPQAEGTDLVVAGSPRLAERLAGVTPAHVVERFEAPTPAVDGIAWGRARFYEQTLLPRTVDPTVRDIDARGAARCVQCGERSLGPACAFCASREGRYV
jgi:hypothetical protein